MAATPPSTRASATAITAARFGETDGLDDRPAMSLEPIRRDRRRARRRAYLAFAATATLVLMSAGLGVLPLLEAGDEVAEVRRPLPHHPFALPEAGGPASIIMQVRGDPIMIRRQEDARPRPIRLDLPARLSDGPGPVDAALRVRDTLISETGGFMGRLPDDPSAVTSIFEESLQPTAEDIYSVMNPAAVDSGDIRSVDYTLLEFDLAQATTTVDEADVEATVRAAALARGWITETRPGATGRAASAAVMRELGSNTSRMVVTVGLSSRPELREILLNAEGAEGLAALMVRNGFDPAGAATVEERFAALHGLRSVAAGHRLFARALRDAATGLMRPRQVALYEGGSFLGAVAVGPGDAWVVGAEPAFDARLDRGAVREPPPAGGYTLRDGIYSAALRNAMPEPIAREAITALSKSTDLSRPANPGDEVDIVYSEQPRDPKGGGRVIYVGLVSRGERTGCYVFRPDPGAPFGCIDGSGQPVVAQNGIIAPVKGGRLTSKFGMRVHPVLKYARLHKGIDWGAPKGTPVMSVLNGTIAFIGVASGYGNYMKVAHDKRTVTAYAHLDRFEPGLVQGATVSQGQRIGYLGNTGLSTGPHLHFEVYVDGKPTDPLTHSFALEAPEPGTPAATGEDPVRMAAFTDRKAVVDKALGLGAE